MYLLPARIKRSNNKVNVENEVNFFYLCLFTIAILFLSALVFRLPQNNRNVLGSTTEKTNNDAEIIKQFNFWQSFVASYPEYYQGWIELYDLTKEDRYLDRAREIDPNR